MRCIIISGSDPPPGSVRGHPRRTTERLRLALASLPDWNKSRPSPIHRTRITFVYLGTVVLMRESAAVLVGRRRRRKVVSGGAAS